MTPTNDVISARYRKTAEGWLIDASRYTGERRRWRIERAKRLLAVADFWRGYP